MTSKNLAESQKHINLDERVIFLHLAKNCTAQQSKCVSMTFQAAILPSSGQPITNGLTEVLVT